MKPQKFLLPRGGYRKISQLITPAVTPDTIRKVCKGRIEGVCSEETARRIYDIIPKVGGVKIN